jgi:hypothetical protein
MFLNAGLLHSSRAGGVKDPSASEDGIRKTTRDTGGNGKTSSLALGSGKRRALGYYC